MVQSLNRKADMTVQGTSYLGVATYGKIMIGDQAFEFYNDRKVSDYIQIPWEEVDYVTASVMWKGKWIPRFAIMTKKNGNYTFSSRDNKALLRGISKYVPADHMVRSLSFFDIIKRGIKGLVSKHKK